MTDPVRPHLPSAGIRCVGVISFRAGCLAVAAAAKEALLKIQARR